MENFITIATFTYPTECFMLRGRLESEGVRCFMKDEHTIQIDNFYSHALGGIKLQVFKEDYDKAFTIAEALGYINVETGDSEILIALEKITDKIPGLSFIRFELRLIILISILITLLALILL